MIETEAYNLSIWQEKEIMELEALKETAISYILPPSIRGHCGCGRWERLMGKQKDAWTPRQCLLAMTVPCTHRPIVTVTVSRRSA